MGDFMVLALGSATPTPAPSGDMIENVMDAVSTGMTQMVSDLGTGIGSVVPVIIPIFGLIIAIGIVKKVVKRLSG